MSRPIELSRTDPNHRRPLVTIETTDPALTPPEVLREQVASALYLSEPAVCPDLPFTSITEREQEHFYRLADAALAMFRGQQDPAVQRVLAVDLLAYGDPDADYDFGKGWNAAIKFADKRIRAAIGGDGR